MLHEATAAFLLTQILFSTVMTLFMIASFLDFTYPKIWICLTFLIFTAYVFSTAWFLLESLSLTMFIRLYIFFIFIPAFILFYVLTEDSLAKLFFIFTTQINLLIIIGLGGKLLNAMMGSAVKGDLFINILLYSGFAVLQHFLIKKYYRRFLYALDCNWRLMTPIPTAFFVLLWIMALYPEAVKITLWHFACLSIIIVLMLAVYAVLFISIVKNYRCLEDSMKNNIMTAQLTAQEQSYIIILEKQGRIYRMRKQVDKASQLLWQGNLGRAADILMDIDEAYESSDARIYCTNSRINEVVSYYAALCIENNIRFACDMNLDRQKLPVPEICLILNYGLENAFEASMKLPMELRFIKLQSGVVQGQFLTRIRNRFSGGLQLSANMPHTEKKAAGHGYGLSSIQAAAKRAHGEMMFRAEEDHFVLDVRVQAKPIDNQ